MTKFIDPRFEATIHYGGPKTSWTDAVYNPREALTLVYNSKIAKVGALPTDDTLISDKMSHLQQVAQIPASYPEWLGDRNFQNTHGTRFAYVGGAMARGIASTQLVIALANQGMLGFFGAAGLSPERVESEINLIKSALDGKGQPFGSNLIHTPDNPDLESKIVELYINMGVHKVSASAFMKLTPSIVHYASKGLRLEDGRIIRPNRIFAKISRTEVAEHFMKPAPQVILDRLVQEGKISREESYLAAKIPVAEDIIVESDSGGHTDNRPLGSLFPAIQLVRDNLVAEYNYKDPIRLGAAGGMGTPNSVAAAYSLGAAFVVIGTVHQSTVEAGISAEAKDLLSKAGIADITMTPSADMFELGVKVQVLKRGTMMAPRGSLLYKLYRDYESIEEIPSHDRGKLEREIFRCSLNDVWSQTQAFFQKVDPQQLTKASEDPKYKMALIFRWYLGKSSQWPIQGQKDRLLDYQIWCGPAMGAFNQWVKGSFLEDIKNRSLEQVSLNLLEGASKVSRIQQLRTYGMEIPNHLFIPPPQILGL